MIGLILQGFLPDGGNKERWIPQRDDPNVIVGIALIPSLCRDQFRHWIHCSIVGAFDEPPNNQFFFIWLDFWIFAMLLWDGD